VVHKERFRRLQTLLVIVGATAPTGELAVPFPPGEWPPLSLLLLLFELVLLVTPLRWNVVRDARPTELGSVQRLGLLEITFKSAQKPAREQGTITY
jgi:hypothetical protein